MPAIPEHTQKHDQRIRQSNVTNTDIPWVVQMNPAQVRTIKGWERTVSPHGEGCWCHTAGFPRVTKGLPTAA